MTQSADSRTTHVLVWRGSRANVVTLIHGGRIEVAAREFRDEYAAIAYLLQVTAPLRADRPR